MRVANFIFAITTLFFAVLPAGANADHSLPDRSLTPGASADDVAQDNIGDTICVPGFTKPPRRPPSSYTSRLKVRQLNDHRYRYADTDPKHYELDHLIPLTLGGAPRNQNNLWPEPWKGRWGARKKDKLEVKLKRLVCAGVVRLDTAQNAIAINWIIAYRKYMPMRIEPEPDDPDDQ